MVRQPSRISDLKKHYGSAITAESYIEQQILAFVEYLADGAQIDGKELARLNKVMGKIEKKLKRDCSISNSATGNSSNPSQRTDGLETSPSTSGVLSVPNYFDEKQLDKDLHRFTRAVGVKAKLYDRIRDKFTKRGQRAILKDYTSLYKAGKTAIDAKTEFERSKITHDQLAKEYEIKLKENEVSAADLEAQKEGHLLRKDEAAHKRTQIGMQPNNEPAKPLKTEDEKRFEEKCSARFIDIQDEVFEELEVVTEKEVQSRKKYNQLRRKIDRDPEFTDDEKDELIERLDKRYTEKAREFSIYQE
jgi:hypothetical protein